MEAPPGPGAEVWKQADDEEGEDAAEETRWIQEEEIASFLAEGQPLVESVIQAEANGEAGGDPPDFENADGSSPSRGVMKGTSPLALRKGSPEARVRFRDPMPSLAGGEPRPQSSLGMDEQPQRSRERNREEHDKDDLVAPRTGVPAHSGRQTAASRADTHTANSGARTGSSWSCSAFQSLPPEVDEDNLGRTASDILQRPGKAIDEGAAGAESIDAGEASREDATSGERSSDNQPNANALPQTVMRLGGSSLMSFDLGDFFRAQDARKGLLPEYKHDTSLLRRPATSVGLSRGHDGLGPGRMRSAGSDQRPGTAISMASSLKSAVSSILSVSNRKIQKMMDGTDVAVEKVKEKNVMNRVEVVYIPTGHERIASLRKLLHPAGKGLTWDDMILKGGKGGQVAVDAIEDYLWVEPPDPNANLGVTLMGKAEMPKSEPPEIWWNVSFCDAKLDAAGVSRITDALWNCTTIMSLDASRNVDIPSYLEGIYEAQPAGLDFALALCPYLMQVTSLTRLSVAGNWLRQEGAIQLVPVLSTNSLLTSLDVGGNNLFKEGMRVLVPPLTTVCTHLTSLSLKSNWIGPHAVQDVCDILFANTGLRELDLGQNGIGAEGTMILCPHLRRIATQLVSLELLDNNLDEQSQRNLFPAVLEMVSLTRLGGLGFGVVGGFFDYVVYERMGMEGGINIASIAELDLSYARMPEFPRVLLGLTGLLALNVGGNKFAKLPWIDLCFMTNLTNLGCSDCEGLQCPPPEIANAGGVGTMKYLREMHFDGRFQTEMVLIMAGDAESGKSTLLKAFQDLSSQADQGASASPQPNGDDDDNEGDGEPLEIKAGTYVPTVGVVLTKWVPRGQDRRLSFYTLDFGGSEIYSVVHEFFMTRGTYVLTFRALDETYDRAEIEANHIDSVRRWVSALRMCAPQSDVLVVLTHQDVVDPSEADRQCRIIDKAFRQERAAGRCTCTLLCGGKIFQVSGLRKGMHVSDLLRTLCEEVKENERWSEPLTQAFVRVRDRLDEMRFRDKLVDVPHEEYHQMVLDCGVHEGHELEDVTRRLHEGLQIRYYGAGKAAMGGRVFLDVFWCSGAFRGLIRLDRIPLMRFFDGSCPGGKQDLTKLAWARRIYLHGYINKGVVKFLWPSQPTSQDYWNAVSKHKLGPEEAEIWNTRIALQDDDYKPILRLLEAYGVLGRAGEAGNANEEIYCPFLGSAIEKNYVDGRGFIPLEEAPLLATFSYPSLPHGFFKRLSMRLAHISNHSELSFEHTIVYTIAGRCRASLIKMETESDSNSEKVVGDRKVAVFGRTIVIDATNRDLFSLAISELSNIECFYVGLQRDSSHVPEEQLLDEWETYRRPPDVLISHSSKSKSKEFAGMVADSLRTLFPDLLILLSAEALSGGRRFIVSEIRIFVPVLDSHYQSSERCRNELQGAYEQGCHIIPLVMASFQFPPGADTDASVYTRWYGDLKSLAGRYRMYVDMRMIKENEEVKIAQDSLEEALEAARKRGEPINETTFTTRSQAVELAEYAVIEAKSHRLSKVVGDRVRCALLAWRAPPLPMEEEHVDEQFQGDQNNQEVIGDTGTMAAVPETSEATCADAPGEAQAPVARVAAPPEEYATAAPKINEPDKALDPHPHMDFNLAEINIECQECLATNEARPCVFDRRVIQQELETFRNEELVRIGKAERPFSEPLATCFNGHAIPLSKVLGDSHGWEAIPCPSCLRRGQLPPFCFSERKLLTFFEGTGEEENDVRDESAVSTNHAAGARVSVVTKEVTDEEQADAEKESSSVRLVPGYRTKLKVQCPDCSTALGTRTRFSVHDLIQAKVFISFHWGIALGEQFSGPFSGHPRARSIRDVLRKNLDLYAFIDTIGPSDEDPGVHARQTSCAIKACNVFVCLLCDAYVNNARCRREFSAAAGSSKFIIPVLLPTEFDTDGDELTCIDGSTGWSSKDVTSQDWWRHATKVSKLPADKAPKWEVLQYFEPVSLVEDPFKYDGDQVSEHTEYDISKRVEVHMFSGEHVKHSIKRTFATWKDAKTALFQALRVQTEGEEGLDLTVYMRAEKRAIALFKMLDLDGSGVIEKDELSQGLARLGFAGDDNAVKKMLMEADTDGNVGIDQDEFVSVIMRVTVEESGTLSDPSKLK